MLELYKRIDDLLIKRNVSQKDLSDFLGLSSAQVYSNWKQRNSIPSADVALKIAQYLNTTVEYLLTGSESNILAEENATLKETLAKINELSKI